MVLKGIIFDLDGTLGNTLPVVVAALQDTFRRYANCEMPPEDVSALFGPTEEGVIMSQVNQAEFPAALRYYLERYSALHEPANSPFPGILRLLEWLRQQGIHRGVVTGKGPGTARISMRAMGLEEYIEVLETGSDEGAIKPDSIRKILAGWHIPPEQAAYVGDMPYDMRAAREAGVLPLAAGWAATATVRRGDGEVQYFDTVDMLRQWLEENIPGK